MTLTPAPVTPPPTVDEEAAEAFAGRILDVCTGGLLTYLIDIGRRTGLLEAAAEGPATSSGLAARAGLHERYVREWLGAMASAGIVEYQPDNGRYWLPAEHAACLTGSGVENLAPLAYFTTVLAAHVPAVSAAFRQGGGVPYSAYLPELRDVMDALWRPMYEQLLVEAIVPLAPGLHERLVAGARVADVACGSGIGVCVLAQAYPWSSFVGFDLDGGAVERARSEAAARGVTNAAFEVLDAAELRVDQPFDAVLVFNALHDQAAPATVLEHIREALVPGGLLLMNEPRVSSNLEDNIGVPGAALTYAVSLLHCMTASLAAGGAGLGTAWGEQVARRLLAEAGFTGVAVHDAPGDPGNAVFVARSPLP